VTQRFLPHFLLAGKGTGLRLGNHDMPRCIPPQVDIPDGHAGWIRALPGRRKTLRGKLLSEEERPKTVPKHLFRIRSVDVPQHLCASWNSIQCGANRTECLLDFQRGDPHAFPKRNDGDGSFF